MPSAIDPTAQMAEILYEKTKLKRPHASDGVDESPKKKTKSTYKSAEFVDSDDDVKEKKPKKDKTNKKDKKGKEDKKDKKERKIKKDKSEKKDSKDRSDKPSSKADKSKTKTTTVSNALLNPSTLSPFYTQTVSLWLPLYPVGFDRPLTSAASQHLDGLVNHYSPVLGGYLLAYRNLNLGERAVRANPANPPTDATPAALMSIDEYAVGFGWLTADVDLFVPSRGASLEGKVILQNEGAIGVSCWDRFNASIEAARLPAGWHYVEYEGVLPSASASTSASTTGQNKKIVFDDDEEAPETADRSMMDADAADAQITGEASEIYSDPTEKVSERAQAVTDEDLQSTGYWVDETGKSVTGLLSFRIKDFDVGLAGDNGYLAIEGTMLSPLDELKLRQQERDHLQRGAVSAFGRKTRRLNEFSITQFGKENEDEESGRRVDVYKGSRPGSPE